MNKLIVDTGQQVMLLGAAYYVTPFGHHKIQVTFHRGSKDEKLYLYSRSQSLSLLVTLEPYDVLPDNLSPDDLALAVREKAVQLIVGRIHKSADEIANEGKLLESESEPEDSMFPKGVQLDTRNRGRKVTLDDGTWGIIIRETANGSGEAVNYDIVYPKLGNYPIYYYDDGDWSVSCISASEVYAIGDAVSRFVYEKVLVPAYDGNRQVGVFQKHVFGYDGNIGDNGEWHYIGN